MFPDGKFPLAPIRGATRAWCRVDPLFTINGRNVDVEVGFDAELSDLIASQTGPIRIDAYIPSGAQGGVVTPDNGFGRGYDIHWHIDSSLRCDIGSQGAYCQASFTCLVPAGNDPTTGHPWSGKLTATADNGNTANTICHAGSTTSKVTVRV